MVIDGLPSHSHYVVARRNDPEAAEALALAHRDNPNAGHGWRPPGHEWDLRAELEARILDRLGEVAALISDLPIGGKHREGKPPKQFPRPASAVEDAERRLRMAHYDEVVADVEAAQERYRQLHGA